MPETRIDQMRQNYTLGGLLEKDVDDDPMVQFGRWFDQAVGNAPGHSAKPSLSANQGLSANSAPSANLATANPIPQTDDQVVEENASGIPSWLEPNAMTLSTTTTDGEVSSRIVLLKGVEQNTFVFYSNYQSRKASQIEANAHVGLCFYWPHLQRQVLVQGTATKIDRDRSRTYFHSRPRESQLGAHVSVQSSTIESREVLLERMKELQSQYPGDTEIPLPDNWGGYAVSPTRIEFWQGRTSRLHDRVVYQHNGNAWIMERLSP